MRRDPPSRSSSFVRRFGTPSRARTLILIGLATTSVALVIAACSQLSPPTGPGQGSPDDPAESPPDAPAAPAPDAPDAPPPAGVDPTPPGADDPAPSTGPTTMLGSLVVSLPREVGEAASIVRHSENGRIYVSTNGSYLLKLSPTDLRVLKTTHLAMGRAHELHAHGDYVYVHVDGSGHRVLKIDPSSLSVVASTGSLGATKSPEGFVFLGGAMYVAVGGPPGKIVKIDQASMKILGEWPLPGGIENHNFTTDGANLFVLGVPTRWGTPNKYYKLSPGLRLLGTLTFPRNGTLGGNIYFPGTGSVYTSPAGIFKIDPRSFTVQTASAHTGRGRLHWLAADSRWLYSLDSANVRVWDPATLNQVCARKVSQAFLHYGIVQDGYLWTASETMPGTVGRYELFPAAGNRAPTVAMSGPTPGASIAARSTVALKASARDPDGRISRVRFYSGTTLLGTDEVSPYGLNWRNVAAGTHTITAKATDDCGATSTSQPFTVTVGR